jgi:hypothetical protein
LSFILDALKKLDREKQAREPGVVMVGPVPWGGVDRRRRARTLVLAAAALGVFVLGTLWWLGAGPTPTAVPRVDRDAATRKPVEPTTTTEPLGTAATRPPAEKTTDARPAPLRHRTATTEAAPPEAPAPRELDLPVAESTTAPLTRSEPANRDEIALAATDEAALEESEESGPVDSPTEETAAPDPEFRLTAISTRDGEPIALLNDRLVREGDSFDGVRVVRIGATDVEIEVDGERRTIGF